MINLTGEKEDGDATLDLTPGIGGPDAYESNATGHGTKAPANKTEKAGVASYHDMDEEVKTQTTKPGAMMGRTMAVWSNAIVLS